jgi:hypothetical protein
MGRNFSDVLGAETSSVASSEWKPGDPIGYISPKIPEFELPPYRGEHYDATVPDTLDIAERARLAVNVLTEATNPLADYEVYWIVSFGTNPPSMTENCWQGHTFEKFMWALVLTRMASGSDQNLNVERRWMEAALKMQGPDGLIYVPVNGRPWAFNGWYKGVEKPRDQILEPFGWGTMLSAMSVLAARDPGPVWKSATRRLVDGMVNQAVVDGDSAYFWPSCMYASKDRPAHPPMPTSPFECEGSVIPQGLVMAYRVLQYEPALTLARQYINFLRMNFYAPDGSFLVKPGMPVHTHTHAHARGLLAMEQCAEAAGDKELMAFVVRAYEHWRDLGSNIAPGVSDYDMIKTPGAGLVGFVPEWTNSPIWQTSETCEVADMLTLAIWLSKAGAGDYWDDADRIIRNQFTENQLCETEWIDELSRNGRPPKSGNNVSTDRVAERNKGAFASAPSVNDWLGRGPAHGGGTFHGAKAPTQTGLLSGLNDLTHCCTANGSKALGWVWQSILSHENGQLRVNLLLNRASPWADLDSYIPYQGRVDVRVKKAVDLSLRIPEWVTPDQAKCQVNQQDRKLGWDGRYAKVGDLKPGDVATLTFPIFERTNKIWVEKEAYTLVRKGNEVVSIDPPGVYYPFYQREHYRQSEPRMRKVKRFQSDESL